MENNEGYFVEIIYDSSKGKHNYFTVDNTLKVDDKVVVETNLGLELGIVANNPVKESQVANDAGIQSIVRKANNTDIENYEKNKEELKSACKIFTDCCTKLTLDMRLISAMYTLDKSKILFCYVAEERVDFRDLLKELSSALKCRIELKQIGARDRSKNVGGIGICGLPLCCSSFLNEFEGISINMAKNQYLALNIQKISGQCNKLLCCLKYEDDDYTRLKEGVPKIGQRFNDNGVTFKITSLNLLSQMARIESEDKEVVLTISIDELKSKINSGKQK